MKSMQDSGRIPPSSKSHSAKWLSRTCGVVVMVVASTFASPIFLIEPQTRKIAPGMAQTQVDSILGKNSIVGRYEWNEKKTAVAIHKYNLVLDHYVPAGALGGASSTRVMPYFVIYALPRRQVAFAGTHRSIMESAPSDLSVHLPSLFAKVVATDTAVCLRMGVEELIQYAERNVGWKHPNWADRLTEFNVRKALSLLEDSLGREAPTADHFRRLGSFHRVRAVLWQEQGFQQAAAAYSRSLALDSNQFHSAFQLAQTRLVAGNPDSAVLAMRLFQHVQRKAKGELKDRARWGIAVSQWRMGWSCRASHSIREYLAIYPTDEGARLLEERLRKPGNLSAPGDTTCPSR
ncbi:MAG: hypothetical protein IPO40_23350 [Fibrobacteres bacterium]|nr:hypothetical protein [Fibrobacterota bacterium]